MLTYRPDNCPRCRAGYQDTMIEYLIDDGGRLLMVGGLPVLRCERDGHLFMSEEIFDRLERLIALQGLYKVKPATTLAIPVFEFVAK